MTQQLANILEALDRVSFHHVDEAEMQAGVAQALEAAGIKYEREVWLSPRDRIDFLVDGSIGIECKVQGSTEALLRQVMRYCQSDRISSLLVVSSVYEHLSLPRQVGGKHVSACRVGDL